MKRIHLLVVGVPVMMLAAACGEATPCERAADHLASCGVTDVAAPESCSLDVANEILASECDALTTRGAEWFTKNWRKPAGRWVAVFVCDIWEDGKTYYSSHYLDLRAWSYEEAVKALDRAKSNAPPGCSFGPIRWVA